MTSKTPFLQRLSIAIAQVKTVARRRSWQPRKGVDGQVRRIVERRVRQQATRRLTR